VRLLAGLWVVLRAEGNLVDAARAAMVSAGYDQAAAVVAEVEQGASLVRVLLDARVLDPLYGELLRWAEITGDLVEVLEWVVTQKNAQQGLRVP